MASSRAEEESDSCPVCGSENIVFVEWGGPTGVTAPDGGEEYRLQQGYRCCVCGAVEDL
jgi:hypothetical protein